MCRTQHSGRNCLGEVRVKPGGIPRGRSIDRQDLTLILRREKYRMDLMEQILSRENMLQALRRVEANKGTAGIDGVTTDVTAGI